MTTHPPLGPDRQQHEPFWRQIMAAPADSTPFRIYSDWLTERDDPRGEFIRLQLQLEQELDGETRTSLKAKEQSLVKQFGRQWLGEPLAAFFIDQQQPADADYFEPTYKFEFIRGILLWLRCELGDPQLVEALDANATETIHTLIVDHVFYDDDGDSALALSQRPFPMCRRLAFGTDTGGADASHLDALVKQMPQLAELEVEARTSDEAPAIFALELSQLRKLSLSSGFNYPLDVLGANESLNNLESLIIAPHMLEHDDTKSYIAGFDDFCDSKHLTSLQQLHLFCTEFGDEGAQQLVKSAFFPQLESLSLFSGTLTRDGLAVLAQQDLSRLKHLNVVQNYIHDAQDLEAQIRLQVPEFELGYQIPGDNTDDFEHLYEGSME